jgi:hypothetical protein
MSVWGQIAGAVIGGVLGNKGAKDDRAAMERANAQNNQYLNAAMPYIKDNMSDVSGFYDDMISKGPYQGDFFAGPNNMQTDMINSMYGSGTDIMNASRGFANNTGDLYSRFTNMSNRPDMMANADQYAQSNMSPIVKAMMRDDTRTLEEQTLPGINMNASGSGNTNASRAGVASAIAERGYNDRLADVSSDVYNSLRDARLAQGNTEFNQGMTALNNAGNMNNQMASNFGVGSNAAIGAGNRQNQFDQGQLDANRQQFDYLNNYNYNLGKDFQGFLTGNNVQGNYEANMFNPTTAAMSGAMAGYGFMNPNAQHFNSLFGGQGGLTGGFV